MLPVKSSLPLDSAPQRVESDWLPDTNPQASPQLGSSNGHLHVTIHRIFSVGGALGETSTFVDPIIAGGKERDCCPQEHSPRANLALLNKELKEKREKGAGNKKGS